LFYWLIKRNIRKEKEESEVIVEDVVTRRAMEDSVRNYIKKVDRFGAMTLMYVDIDGFADLNEVFGKVACDLMLKEIATRILRVIPYNASVCRYQNDEFMVFIKDEDNFARLESIASKIVTAAQSPYQVLIGETITLSVSVGMATYPNAGQTFEELYSNLELTTYVSKRDGGNKFTNFYATIKEEELNNMNYFQEVKQAIQKKEFVLYYQPILNLADKLMNGAEALMRWNHPTKGVQSPATFLKVLEQSGDIKWVGEWGIETMINMHNTMQEKFPTVPLRFSLNLSTKQLLDPQLANSFIEIMNKRQAKPEWFMLEVNDFMMVERIAVIKTNIYKLRDYGFKIAVDGFELDGQSVQNIQKSPVDVIKLGRNFLKDVENNFMKERFLQILVKYAEDNNKELICEGMENAKLTKYVKEQNVFLGQGYYFAKPLSEDAFEEYIEKRQYQVLLDDVSALEDNEALFKQMHSDALQDIPAEEAEEFPEEYLDRMARENAQSRMAEEESNDKDLLVSDPSDDDLLV
jgi:diguanylate cyclase (GGDEF)-like protein